MLDAPGKELAKVIYLLDTGYITFIYVFLCKTHVPVSEQIDQIFSYEQITSDLSKSLENNENPKDRRLHKKKYRHDWCRDLICFLYTIDCHTFQSFLISIVVLLKL